MITDERFQVIRGAVAELVALEEAVGATLERTRRALLGPPEALAAVERFASVVETHRAELAACFDDSAGGEPNAAVTAAKFAGKGPTGAAEMFRDLCAAFNRCAIDYAVLYAMALRLYEPRLRQIAPKHLEAYADIALSATRLLPAVVASELARNGLECSCICPMCGIGACGCVALGTQAVIASWRDAATTESAPAGFLLRAPRRDSELAQVGVQGGEVLLAVDGQPVRAIAEIQTAIRKHPLGDEVHLLVQAAPGPPRQVTVRHVSDYPRP